MAAEQDDFLGEIRLGRQLSTVWQVAAGGLVIGFALTFLVPGRVDALIGSISPFATLLMLLILVFTILNILELLAGSSDHGGTYTLIHETLGGIGGFQAGWVIFAGSLTLTACFIQSAAAQLDLFLQLPTDAVTALAASLILLMVVFQLFRIIPRRTWLAPGLTVLTLIIGLMLVDIFLKYDLHIDTRSMDFVSGNFMRAAAWLFAIYGAIEAVISSRRQVRDAQQRLPRSLFATIAIAGVVLIAFEFIPTALPQDLIDVAIRDLPAALQQTSRIPGRLIHVITFLLFTAAANASLVMGARQLNALSRQGALPSILRWLKRPFRVQPIIFGLILVVSLPLLIWAPIEWLLDMAAGFFLISAFLLNLAALISRRSEPNRRRTLQVAFYPLVPMSALAFCIGMWIALPGYGLLGNAIWITLGLLLYATYSHMHLIEAQEGVLVFRRAPGREKKEGDYRILVPLSTGLERHWILDLSMALAHQTNGEVIPLQVIPIADPLAIAEGGRIANERNTLFQWSTRIAAKSDVPTFPITRLARSVPEGILETADEEDCDLILLSWVVRPEEQGVHMGRVLDPVIRRAPNI
jgi:APA family basic amino acid/polyamine antiporter